MRKISKQDLICILLGSVIGIPGGAYVYASGKNKKQKKIQPNNTIMACLLSGVADGTNYDQDTDIATSYWECFCVKGNLGNPCPVSVSSSIWKWNLITRNWDFVNSSCNNASALDCNAGGVAAADIGGFSLRWGNGTYKINWVLNSCPCPNYCPIGQQWQTINSTFNTAIMER